MSFEQEQARLLRLYQEVLTDEEVDNSDSEEVDNEEESQHDTESEQDMSDVQSENDGSSDSSESSPRNYYVGKDKTTRWRRTVPSQNVRTRSENLIRKLPGPVGLARASKTPIECYSLFIDTRMIRMIVANTNIYINNISDKFSRNRDAKQTDEDEVKAFLGLLILAGVFRGGHQNLQDFWNQDGYGIDLFYATMSLKRFLFLLRCLRFDNVDDRTQRREIDKLAAIRDIFELFVANCERHYVPGEYVTIDEQLVAFRGRCPFRQYIPSKPAKYGIKILTLTDARTMYTKTMEIYPGIQPEGPYRQSNKPDDVVLRLVRSIENSGRNVTIDNWFTSIPLARELLKKKLTMVGTIRKNKREIPRELLNVRNRNPGSSIFAFQKDITLVSVVPKKTKMC